MSASRITVRSDEATYIAADSRHPVEVLNAGGHDVFYKNAPDVDSGDTKREPGQTVELTDGAWFVTAAATTELNVREMQVDDFEGLAVGEDLTVAGTATVTGATTLSGAATVGTTLGVTGATTPSGGVVTPTAVPGFYAGDWNPVAATSGTDTTPAEKKLFVSSLFLPVNKKIKGIGFLVGSVGGTNKAVAGLFSAAGKLLAHSSEATEGTLVGTAAEIQELALTAEYSAVGPALYFVGITMNGNTARLRTIPKNTVGSNLFSKVIDITTKNTLADIAAPSALEADKGPVAWVY